MTQYLLLSVTRFYIDWIVYYIQNKVRDRMVVGFTTTYAISAHHHWCCEFECQSGRGEQHYV